MKAIKSESRQKKPKDSSYRETLRARRKAFWDFVCLLVCLFVFEKGIFNLDEVKDFSAVIYIANKQTNKQIEKVLLKHNHSFWYC